MSHFDNLESSNEQLSKKKDIESFHQNFDMINRDRDLVSRSIYYEDLEDNRDLLGKSFNESNAYFKNDFINDDESDEFLLNLVETKNLNDISAGEIYILKNQGYDLSNLFLIGNGNSKNSMVEGDEFIVNFGKNKSLNKSIGAGDLVDIENIDRVKINGVEGVRKLNPRPGYYSSNGRYLSIYDNYKIEIVSNEKYLSNNDSNDIDELQSAFNKRFSEVRSPEVYSSIRNQIYSSGNNSEVKLEGFSKFDLSFIVKFFNNLFKNNNIENNSENNSENRIEDNDMSYNKDDNSLSTKNGKTFNELSSNFSSVEGLGKGYEKYKNEIVELSNKYGIKKENLIKLINHENRNWDPYISAAGSSAYGLGQMIDSTWITYGKGLDRNNPKDQLEATCRYLEAIKRRQSCSDELAMAYYNTGEGIKNISDSKVKDYARLNPAIANKIPNWMKLTPKSYFLGAVAYYNDIDFLTAQNFLKNSQTAFV